MESEKSQLVPISALKHDLVVDDLKKSAASQALGIAPFKNGPIPYLENVLRNAHHLGRREARRGVPSGPWRKGGRPQLKNNSGQAIGADFSDVHPARRQPRAEFSRPNRFKN